MITNVPPKSPDSVKWYWFTWQASELNGGSISTLTWTLPAGVTKSNQSIASPSIGILLAGGTEDTKYEIKGQITTSIGETLHMRFVVECSTMGH